MIGLLDLLPSRTREGWREAPGRAFDALCPPPLGYAVSPLPHAGEES
jgi:hypothetical protein